MSWEPDMTSTQIWTQLLWTGFLGASLASVGFGVLFNVRGKSLWLAGITGGVGGFVYELALIAGWPDSIANFAASIALCTLAEIFARYDHATVTTFTACALIPLVPGGTAYQMMVEFQQGHAMAGIQKGLDLVSVSAMLALGIMVVSTLTRFFYYSKKKLANGGEVLYQSHALHSQQSAMKKIARLHDKQERLQRKVDLIAAQNKTNGSRSMINTAHVSEMGRTESVSSDSDGQEYEKQQAEEKPAADHKPEL